MTVGASSSRRARQSRLKRLQRSRQTRVKMAPAAMCWYGATNHPPSMALLVLAAVTDQVMAALLRLRRRMFMSWTRHASRRQRHTAAAVPGSLIRTTTPSPPVVAILPVPRFPRTWAAAMSPFNPVAVQPLVMEMSSSMTILPGPPTRR